MPIDVERETGLDAKLRLRDGAGRPAGEADVDFSGTGPVLAGNLNANPAIVSSAVLYAFRTLIGDDIPLNGGILDPIRITVPESLLNPRAAANPAEKTATATKA